MAHHSGSSTPSAGDVGLQFSGCHQSALYGFVAPEISPQSVSAASYDPGLGQPFHNGLQRLFPVMII
jgi:hypothetical protein